MNIRYSKNQIKVMSEGPKCFTKLSIGGEDDCRSDMYTISKDNEDIVNFSFTVFCYIKDVEESIDHIGSIYSYLELEELISILDNERINEGIVTGFLKYIKNSDNEKYILYIA